MFEGPGLMFIVYPAVFRVMPAPQFWAVSFFFMLILLGSLTLAFLPSTYWTLVLGRN